MTVCNHSSAVENEKVRTKQTRLQNAAGGEKVTHNRAKSKVQRQKRLKKSLILNVIKRVVTSGQDPNQLGF